VREATDETFEREVLAAAGPVVVDFWAPWCGPCKAADAALAALVAERPGSFALVKVNVDESFAVASRYEVLTLPTVILFADGEPRVSLAGARSRGQYAEAFAPFLPEG
jgi:thioredoxin